MQSSPDSRHFIADTNPAATGPKIGTTVSHALTAIREGNEWHIPLVYSQ
jgi:hypothetical protein